MKASPAFELFAKEAPKHQQAWMNAVKAIGEASALDTKTQHLTYLAVLAAEELQNGIPFDMKIPNKETLKAMQEAKEFKGEEISLKDL